ncbi:MAG: hypothetical protein E7017_03310 [Alphaproteobacteria bacterium]|nr:hypothetical protein [Alphaproteobacteria bacterium]
MNNADWYVPSINTAETQLPDGLYITMFDAKNHINEGLTSEQIRQEYEQNAKAVGEYILSLSPERLALHETIVAMSMNLKFQSEDDFVKKFHEIYKDYVLPQIQDKSNYFEQMAKIRRKSIERSAQQYFSENRDDTDIKYKSEFEHYDSRFVKNYERYEAQLEELKKRTQKERPTRAEREEINQLQKTVDFMKENKERIIVDLVANTVTLNENKRLVENIISGKDGIFDSNYIEQFEKLTQHTSETRNAFLIVGGAASGKGSVTEAVKSEQHDRSDILEINPDLYKKLLLPFEDVKDFIELHGSLTHAESSIIFDSIAERWQNSATRGNAPNILMDVARAGNWQLNVLGAGETKISANTPMLPIEVALERSYKRGEKTGRFMPTRELIQGHKDQISLNKNAMKRGVDYRFYDTNVNFGEPTPLVAQFDAKTSKMDIYDAGVMWDYFSKSQLNPEARTADDLSFATPKSTVKEFVEHAEFMDISILDREQHNEIASLSQKEGKMVCEIKDFSKLRKNMGDKTALMFLNGLQQNNVDIKGSPELLNMIEKLNDMISTMEQNKTSANIDVNCEQYATLLSDLIEKGTRVGKTENAYIYDFANDPELKDKKLTIGTKNLDIISKEASLQSYNEYDPKLESKRQKVLIIDAKVYNTPQKRENLINRMKVMLKTTGRFEAEGVYMNERRKISDDYIFNNSGNAEIQIAKPNPEAVRVAYKITDKAVKIPVQWGEYAIEKDGSLVIRERDLPDLRRALRKYKKDKNPAHLLQNDGKAKIDVYGTDPFFIEDNYSYIYNDSEYRETLNSLLEQGMVVEPKNSAKYDTILAYQIQEKDQIVTPDGALLREGDWLCVPVNEVTKLQKQLDNNENVTGIYSIRKATMQKSYNLTSIRSNIRIERTQ